MKKYYSLTEASYKTKLIAGTLLAALLFSGIAAIVNQTVWQRALKIYLAGNDALSSTIVVMVFMGGLGSGSLFVGKVAQRIRNPLFLFGLIEILLCVFNLGIALLLGQNVSNLTVVLQEIAINLQVSRYSVFAFVSAAILFVPCFLMGMTIPLASEIAQSQLGIENKSFLSNLFVLNTLGAVGGVLITGLYALPLFGQRITLFCAVGANGVAGFSTLVLSFLTAGEKKIIPTAIQSKANRIFSSQNMIGFFLGFLALAYEMYLFRIVALAHQPLPDRFAIILGFYLLFWSLGLFLAGKRRYEMGTSLFCTAIGLCCIPCLFALQIWGDNVYLFTLIYTAPCFGLGIIFALMVEKVSVRWGSDIGYFQGFNTLGSCLGVFVVGLFGYAINHLWVAVGIGIGYLLLFVYILQVGVIPSLTTRAWKHSLIFTSCLACTIFCIFILRQTQANEKPDELNRSGTRSYFGREGVVEVVNDRDMFWNGMWHSQLSKGDHVGTRHWLQAVIPFLSFPCREKELSVLVVGLGVGITAAVIAQSPRVAAVDAYEINPNIKKLLLDFPEGSLNVLQNKKIKIFWEDARAGLSLRQTKYDLIIQEPLYLKQAGSSLLFSKEYFSLVRSRLKPGGIFSIYSNAQGHLGQVLLVRNTALSVFNYGESFMDGFLSVVSDSPIRYPACGLEVSSLGMGVEDRLWSDITNFGIPKLDALLDRPRLKWDGIPFLITDDQPLVEYPLLADAVVTQFQNRVQQIPEN